MAETVVAFKPKFGRIVPTVIHPHLKLKNYLDRVQLDGNAFTSELINPPAGFIWVPSKVGFGLHNALGNLYHGDCTDAAAGHITDVWNFNAKNGRPPLTQEQIIAFAKANGSLNGGILQNVLAFWQQHGLLLDGTDDAIVGYAGVTATNEVEVKTAIWLFGNCYTGVSLPDEWVNASANIQNGFVWDVAGAPNPNNGHCVPWLGYTTEGVIIDTWGFIGTITWAAVEKYFVASAGGEVYTALSQNWINNVTAVAPNGFNFTQLQADLAAIS